MKKTVAIDLDGVLAQYDHWCGVEHIGDPIPGAKEFVARLAEKYEVVIHTTRCSPDVNPGHNSVTLSIIVKSWLDKHSFVYDKVWIGKGKPIAVAYVDDRAVLCVPQLHPLGPSMAFSDTLDDIEKRCSSQTP